MCSFIHICFYSNLSTYFPIDQNTNKYYQVLVVSFKLLEHRHTITKCVLEADKNTFLEAVATPAPIFRSLKSLFQGK